MKKIIKGTLKFIQHLMEFGYFLLQLLIQSIKNRSLSNSIKKKYSGAVAILANGPSLKDVLPKLTTKEFENTDFMVMNFFAFDDMFFQIKPKHYCLADPMFYRKNHSYNKVLRFFELLQKNVDWQMNLYVKALYRKDFLSFSKINNPHIKIVPVNSKGYRGFDCFRNFFYKSGLASPHWASVIIQAIYVSINLGYTKVYLYGADHNFFSSLVVNDQNQLCKQDSHFYSSATEELKPVVRSDNGKVYRFHEYLNEYHRLFIAHEQCAKYAKYRNVEILNCTDNSMIDSYKRKF